MARCVSRLGRREPPALRAGAFSSSMFMREALDLVAEHVERHRRAGLEDVLALDHRLVDLRAAVDVVGLHGQQLLEDVGGAVGLERPDLHLAEPLAAEARLAAERLLRDEAVRARRARVDLLVHEVVQLQHVQVADGDLLVERLAGAAVVELDLAVASAGPALLEHLRRCRPRSAPSNTGVDARGSRAACAAQPRWVSRIWPTFMRLGTPSGLSTISTGVPSSRNGMSSIGQDAADDALVAVAAGHLVADREVAPRRDVDLDHLEHAGRQLVAAREPVDELVLLRPRPRRCAAEELAQQRVQRRRPCAGPRRGAPRSAGRAARSARGGPRRRSPMNGLRVGGSTSLRARRPR